MQTVMLKSLKNESYFDFMDHTDFNEIQRQISVLTDSISLIMRFNLNLDSFNKTKS